MCKIKLLHDCNVNSGTSKIDLRTICCKFVVVKNNVPVLCQKLLTNVY